MATMIMAALFLLIIGRGGEQIIERRGVGHTGRLEQVGQDGILVQIPSRSYS